MRKLWVFVLWGGRSCQEARMGAVSAMTDEDPLVHVDILIRASQRRRELEPLIEEEK